MTMLIKLVSRKRYFIVLFYAKKCVIYSTGGEIDNFTRDEIYGILVNSSFLNIFYFQFLERLVTFCPE